MNKREFLKAGLLIGAASQLPTQSIAAPIKKKKERSSINCHLIFIKVVFAYNA